MARRNRTTLKEYFRSGTIPQEDHFRDLIDSLLNIMDDGFDHSPDHGLKIRAAINSSRLLSFFQKSESTHPLWTLGIGEEQNSLVLQKNGRSQDPLVAKTTSSKSTKTSFTFTDDGKLGINRKNPTYAVDVEGVVTSTGRRGRYQDASIPADGKWHPITPELTGCNGFEVMAGVGKKGHGQYALLHAIALNTFMGKKKIRPTQSYYHKRCCRMHLRWRGTKESYTLEMKTTCNLGKEVAVRYHMTQLWFDPFMDESLQ